MEGNGGGERWRGTVEGNGGGERWRGTVEGNGGGERWRGTGENDGGGATWTFGDNNFKFLLEMLGDREAQHFRGGTCSRTAYNTTPWSTRNQDRMTTSYPLRLDIDK